MDDKTTDKQSDSRRDSVSMVGPYARIRIIAAVIVFLFVIVVMIVRALSG
ncbi:hypothetical protein [Thalassovita sp.]|nr:hypothetical protein [Thalassovita sp.]